MTIETVETPIDAVTSLPVTTRSGDTFRDIDITRVTPEIAPFLEKSLPLDTGRQSDSRHQMPERTPRRTHSVQVRPGHTLPHQVDEQAAMGNPLALQARRLTEKFHAQNVGVVFDFLVFKTNVRRRR